MTSACMSRLIDVHLADCWMLYIYMYYCVAFQVSKTNTTIIGYCSNIDIVTINAIAGKNSTIAVMLIISISFLTDQILVCDS